MLCTTQLYDCYWHFFPSSPLGIEKYTYSPSPCTVTLRAGERKADRAAAERVTDARDGAQPVHRLRQRREGRQEGPQGGHHPQGGQGFIVPVLCLCCDVMLCVFFSASKLSHSLLGLCSAGPREARGFRPHGRPAQDARPGVSGQSVASPDSTRGTELKFARNKVAFSPLTGRFFLLSVPGPP